MRRSTGFLLALALIAGPLAGVAQAGPPGTWTRISNLNGANTEQAGAIRTSDGVLHVAWRTPNPTTPTNDDLMHTPVSAAGVKGANTVITANWTGLYDPDFALDLAGNLRIFFGGTKGSDTGLQNSGLNTATAPSSGSPWTLTDGHIVGNSQGAASADMGATTLFAGMPETATFFQAWGAWDHAGVASTPAPQNHLGVGWGCCAGGSELVADDSTDDLFVGWHSNATGHRGVYVREIIPAGGYVDDPVRMPGSATMYNGSLQSSPLSARTPMVNRPDKAGAFVAYPAGYPTTSKVLVWRIGAASSMVVRNTPGNGLDDVALASTSSGRLWVLWSDEVNSRDRIFARRSNLAGTTWGKTVSIAAPSGTTSIWRLNAIGGNNLVDVLAHLSKSGSTSTYHTQIKPGLTFTATPQRFRRTAEVKFTVKDAGVPVTGARVTAGGRSALTNASGVARIRVGPYSRARNVQAKATKTGYTPSTLTLRVTA